MKIIKILMFILLSTSTLFSQSITVDWKAIDNAIGYAVDIKTGKDVWVTGECTANNNLGVRYWGKVQLENGKLYAIGQELINGSYSKPRLYSFVPDTGLLIGSVELPDYANYQIGPPSFWRPSYELLNYTVSDGVAFARNELLIQAIKDDGNILWQDVFGGNSVGNGVVTGNLIATTSGKSIIVYDRLSGTRIWTWSAQSRICWLIISHKGVIVIDDSGSLYFLTSALPQ